MTDVGKDVRIRHAKGSVACLGESVSKMMSNWTEDNFPYFEQTMNLIREGAPVQWVKLYMEAVKMGLVKETNINVNINRQQDRESLQALVRTRIPVGIESYTPYEEVKNKEVDAIPIIKEK